MPLLSPFPASLSGWQLVTRGRGQSPPSAAAVLSSPLPCLWKPPAKRRQDDYFLLFTLTFSFLPSQGWHLLPPPTPSPAAWAGCRARPCPGLPEHPGGAGACRQGPHRRGPGMRDVTPGLPQRHPPPPLGLLQRGAPAPAARPAPLQMNGGGGVKQSRRKTPR